MLVDVLLKFVYPPGLCLVLLLAAFVLLIRKRTRASGVCICSAILLLLLCGNEWVVRWAVASLESRYLPLNPVPHADCLLVLGGGVLAQEPPRPSVEIDDAGDRVLYAARLYKQHKASLIVLAGGKGPGSTRATSEAEDGRDLLELLGIPREALLLETGSANTYENTQGSSHLLRQKKVRRVLLVTSARHMPRALAVARRQLPEMEVIAAPTDFLVTAPKPQPLLRWLGNWVPTTGRLMRMEDVLHEYLGLLYYRARGWM